MRVFDFMVAAFTLALVLGIMYLGIVSVTLNETDSYINNCGNGITY